MFRIQTDITSSPSKCTHWGKFSSWEFIYPANILLVICLVPVTVLWPRNKLVNETDEMYKACRCLTWWFDRWLTFTKIEKKKIKEEQIFVKIEQIYLRQLKNEVEVYTGTFGVEIRDEMVFVSHGSQGSCPQRTLREKKAAKVRIT